MYTPPSQNSHPAFPSRGQELQFLQQLVTILEQINRGLRIEEILETLFDSFITLLPYDRIGFHLIDSQHYSATAIWSRAKYPLILLEQGFSIPLKGSSLERILLSGHPRIINNLQDYAREHPESQASELLLKEGIRSSLTFPITRADTPIGFIFFSSCQPNTYKPAHIDTFRWLSEPLGLALDKAHTYERLVALNDEKNLLLGVAAHDLRNPIAQLQLMGELLQTETVNTADRKEIAGMVVTRCQNMLTLLQDLLDLAAIEAGRLPLRLEPLRLAPFCQGLLKSVAPMARAKQISLELQGANDLTITADPARLSQVLDNLLTNAIRYSPPHGSITLIAQEQPKHWELAIVDQGPGISPADISKLFKPFGAGSALPTGGDDKFSLGLSIVKKIVEAHGGDISVESEPSRGTTFRVRLPKLKA